MLKLLIMDFQIFKAEDFDQEEEQILDEAGPSGIDKNEAGVSSGGRSSSPARDESTASSEVQSSRSPSRDRAKKNNVVISEERDEQPKEKTSPQQRRARPRRQE